MARFLFPPFTLLLSLLLFKLSLKFSANFSRMVNSYLNLRGISRENRIKFSQKIVDLIYEILPLEQKYVTDKIGNINQLDPVMVVRNALEQMQCQLDPAWYSWGTKSPTKIINYNYEFNKFLDQVADVLHITKTKLISITIDKISSLYQKVISQEQLSSMDLQDLIFIIANNIYELKIKDYSPELNKDKQVIYALCDKLLEDTGNELGSIGIYICDINQYEYFKRAHELVELLSRGLEPYTLSDKEARLWYLKQEIKIRDLLDSRLPLKLQAVQAFYLRNCLRIKTRQLMENQRLANLLMKTEENYDWKEIVEHYKNKNYKGNALWNIIIEGSMKSRQEINKRLGIHEWEIYSNLRSSNFLGDIQYGSNLRSSNYLGDIQFDGAGIDYFQSKYNINKRNLLIQRLRNIRFNGRFVSFNEEEIIGVVEKYDTDRIVWLELGNPEAGLIHLIGKHLDDFKNYLGLNNQELIVDLILKTIAEQNEIEKIENKGRYVYDLGMINGKHRYIAIIIADNGFIVNAFPCDK